MRNHKNKSDPSDLKELIKMMFLPHFSVGVLWTMASTTRVMARRTTTTNRRQRDEDGDSDGAMDDDGNGNGTADNDDDDDNDGNNDDVNDNNLLPRVGKRNDDCDKTKTEEEETVTDSVEIHTTIKPITGRGGGRWCGDNCDDYNDNNDDKGSGHDNENADGRHETHNNKIDHH